MADPGPLADLHRHLDGSIRKATLEELAKAQRKPLPRRIAFEVHMGIGEALARFQFILAVLQRPEAVRRVAAEVCEDAAAEGVTTLEVRFAPQLHRGAAPAAVVDAALEGLAGRAGLILCGLYGELPEVLEELVTVAIERPGVVGIDLAGAPQPSQRWIMEDYREAFARAAEAGLGRTVHAGEGRPPEEVAIAVETLGAQRIGHATTLFDDPAVLELVIERGVVVEACPSSNVHTGAARSFDEHPLGRYLERGVRACLCTDNTLLSETTAPEEARRARHIPGVTEERLAALVATGHERAFRRS